MAAKVLLVGWDAADWRVINPLMDRNLMPATERLVNGGVLGHMATLSPALSPMLWTSIATGKRPYKHGILGFAEPAPDGGVQPVTNLSRKTKACWNILCQNGLRCHVVGWWPSHPVEPIDGVMVSNHYQRASGPRDRGWPIGAASVHPERLLRTLADLRIHPQELTAEHVLPFIPLAATIDQEKDRRLEMCVKTIAECSSIQSCATYLLENEPWDLMAVYFDAIDHFCHGFMQYHPPQQDWISDEDFALYQHVVTASYVYHDMMLARLVELAGPDTTVMLISDHGFHPDHLRCRVLPNEPAGPAAEHRDFGIFVLHGPGIKRDELIHGVSVLDVTPTLLTLFGLPAGADMDGRALAEAFDERPDIASIPSWDDVPGADGRHVPGRHVTPADAREGIEQLVALGYIDRPAGNLHEAARDAERELQYNLARAYMDGGLHGKAVPLLVELYCENPLEFRFGIQLAICLQALGVVNDLARLIDDLNERWRRASREARRRLADIARIVKARRRARSGDPDSPASAGAVPMSREERLVVRKLRSIARGNPSTLDFLAGWVATARENYAAALAHFAKAEQSQSTAPGFHLQLGDAYLQLDRHAEAEACFRRVLDLDSSHPHGYLGLSRVHLRRRQPRRAAEAASRAVALRFHLPAGHYCLGLARLALRDVPGAIDAFERALSQNPNFAEAHSRLARIHARIPGNRDSATSHREMALHIRSERRRQAGAQIIRELPPLDSIHYDDHLPEFPSEGTATSRLPSLGDPPAPHACAARDATADASHPVIVVSGLPRSGTSLMMQMLRAGGVQSMTDGERPADISNPHGYFELARVKALPRCNGWLDEARGLALKVVAPLVPFLPQHVSYRVIVMHRDLDEIVASQRRMLERMNDPGSTLDREQLKLLLRQQFRFALRVMKAQGVPALVVAHGDVIRQPDVVARRVAAFLDRPLDLPAMACAVDSELYRERADEPIAR